MTVAVVGTSKYGRVDQCPGLFHVETDFQCINLFPLVPKASYLVTHRPIGHRVFRIPLSRKSVIFAYLRAVVLVLGFLTTLMGTVFATGIRADWEIASVFLGGGALCWGILLTSYWFSRARPERAVRIAEQARLDTRLVAEYFLSRGVTITEEMRDPT